MTKTRFSRSVAKYVRRQKALIRKKHAGDKAEQERLSKELLDRLTPSNES